MIAPEMNFNHVAADHLDVEPWNIRCIGRDQGGGLGPVFDPPPLVGSIVAVEALDCEFDLPHVRQTFQIERQVAAGEARHPETARTDREAVASVVGLRAGVNAHAVEIDDGLYEPDTGPRRQRAGGAAFVFKRLR
jgi:hypothetical protein